MPKQQKHNEVPKDLESISLLQGYYHFLYIGQFLDTVIKTKDLSKVAQDTQIETGDKTTFLLKKEKIQGLLSMFHNNADQKNLFGYMVETNGLKGIFATMREMIERDERFRDFVQSILKDQFFPFEQVIIFIRNVLVHTQAINPILERGNITRQKAYLLERDVTSIGMKFCYSDYIAGRTGSKTYGMHIILNFKRMKQGQKLTDVISLHDQYLLAELCFNLCELYKKD